MRVNFARPRKVTFWRKLAPAVWLCALGACSDRSVVVGEERTASTGATGGGDGAGGHAGAPSGAGGAAQRPAFALGADISWVQEEEDRGMVYVDGGVERDVLEILKDHGFNYVRLRLLNDPSSPCRPAHDGEETCGFQTAMNLPKPYSDLENTLLMAQRIKAAGMGFLLNFHYSDTWTDPYNQHKPLAWEALDFPDLVVALRDFTRDSLLAFESAGALPDMVQIGNDITPGFLFPSGRRTNEDWQPYTTLLKEAISAVREVDPEIRVMLHIERADSFSTSDWWVSRVLELGVEFDVLGQSCFTEWHGPPEGWQSSFEQLAAKYPELEFAIAQYSHEKRGANDIIWGLPGGRGLGTFIWEPTRWGEALFDEEGSQLVTNDLIHLYDEMARDYGLRDE